MAPCAPRPRPHQRALWNLTGAGYSQMNFWDATVAFHAWFTRPSAPTRQVVRGEAMMTFGFLLILAALIAVIVGGALSVLRIAPNEAGRLEHVRGVPARVLCPIIGDVTKVRLGPDPADGRLAVIWCERFGDAPLRCDRSCFGAAIAGSLA